MAAPDPIEPVDRLRRSMLEVLELLRAAAGSEYAETAARVEAAAAGLSDLVGILRMRRAGSSEAYWAWLHEARSLVNVMVGWARMLRYLDSDAKHARARDAIERNAQRLEQMLGESPGLD